VSNLILDMSELAAQRQAISGLLQYRQFAVLIAMGLLLWSWCVF